MSRLRTLLVASIVALVAFVGGATAADNNAADRTDAGTILSALQSIRAEVGKAETAAKAIQDRNVDPPAEEPPVEEPVENDPIPPAAEFVGNQISDFPERISGHSGAITEGTFFGKHAIQFAVRNSDVAPATPTNNPRAQLGTPSFLSNGWEGWVRTEIYMPSGINSWNGWFNFGPAIYGPPYGGSGPIHTESWDGKTIQWGRQRTYHEDVPWKAPLPRDQWFSIMWHVKMGGASSGWIELYFNGVQQTLRPSSGGSFTRLPMATYDGPINGGGPNNARISQYRQANLISSEVKDYFTGVWIGPTRASVGG